MQPIEVIDNHKASILGAAIRNMVVVTIMVLMGVKGVEFKEFGL